MSGAAGQRTEERRAFVEGTDWQGGEIAPLSADASFRSYYRVSGPHTAVLMDAPPEHEDVRPFMALTGHLRSLGLSAPAIYAADIGHGFLLLEDLGDERVSQRLKGSPEEEHGLYARAIEILVHLHETAPPKDLPFGDGQAYTLPPYDMGRLQEEAALLPDWFIVRGMETPLEPAARAAYDDAWEPLLAEVSQARSALVLRDYHVDNLMCLDDRPGLESLGLLDYQDALIGHPAYDLVSLLEDARRQVPDKIVPAMLARYMDRAGLTGSADKAALKRAYDILGAQRNAKIIGIFTRLSRRDGKHAYLSLIPHVWRLLEEDLDRLGGPGLTAWLNDHVPAAWRRRPLLEPAAEKKD